MENVAAVIAVQAPGVSKVLALKSDNLSLSSLARRLQC